jgi:hypothetical protein
MLILELITSLMIWVMILIPINSYIIGINERSPYRIVQDVSSQTIFDATKVTTESLMNRSDLCEGGEYDWTLGGYNMVVKNIPVKSTSTEAVFIVSDGQNLFVGLNSASTTDYDLAVYDYRNIEMPLDEVDSGPGLTSGAVVGKSLFVINSSVNSVLQRFKFDSITKKLIKTGDYKIPWSSSVNPVYGTKISAIYPNLFLGLKKNNGEELLSIDLNKLDDGLSSAIKKKWELDSSVQDIWPMYDTYLHLLISTAKEPEINDFCLNCDFVPYPTSTSTLTPTSTSTFATSSPLNTYDLFGSLGNVRSMILINGEIYIGRSAGNNELFKINMTRDYSSTSPSSSYDLINSIDVNEGIYSMLLSNKYLFLVTGKTNSKIQIRDVNNLSNIIQTIDTNSTVSDLECMGNRIFGVGSVYDMNGTSAESITPIIFEIKAN